MEIVIVITCGIIWVSLLTIAVEITNIRKQLEKMNKGG